jgi:cytochrome d ubiquinol oxidase subunit II
VSLCGFTLIGAIFISLKTSGSLEENAQRTAMRLWFPTTVLTVLFVVYSYFQTDILTKLGVNPGAVPFGALIALLATGWFIYKRQMGWGFTMMAFSIVLAGATIFMDLFPRVLISSLNPAWSLTIYNAASGQVTLQTMSIVTLICLPIVLAYEVWSYWIFRKRITHKVEELHY